jgi:predicted short-subunit dehydrogenase-like oxidoreductase (DUF2520 family)
MSERPLPATGLDHLGYCPECHPSARPRVGVIGVGRAGSVLGAALVRAGYPVTAVAAVSDVSRARAAELLPGVPVLPPDEVAARAELVILAVPDDALTGLAGGLAAAGALRPGQFVAHLSGAHGLGVLAPVLACGARPLGLHPAMALTGQVGDIDRLAGAAFAVTAAPGDLSFAEQVVRSIGGAPVPVDEALRPLWHAGLAHGANHLVTLVASAAAVVRAAGVSDPAAAIGPLLHAALDNALADAAAGASSAVTGPVSRGDAGTVAAHLHALAEYAPAERSLYLELARASAARLGSLPDADMLDVLADLDVTSDDAPTRSVDGGLAVDGGVAA